MLREAEIVLDRKLSPEEQKDIIDHPEQVQKYYQDKLTSGASIKLQNAIADLEDRHKDIVRLEKVKFICI